MKTYLFKWGCAGLIWPLIYIATFNYITWSQEAVLALWPTSIMLMALGAEINETVFVIQVYTMSIASNVLLYTFIGLIIKLFVAMYNYSNEKNT